MWVPHRPEEKAVLVGITEDGDRHRMAAFSSLWKSMLQPGDGADACGPIAQWNRNAPPSSPHAPLQPTPLQAALCDPVGVGRTTVATEWTALRTWGSPPTPTPRRPLALPSTSAGRDSPALCRAACGAGLPEPARGAEGQESGPGRLAQEQTVLFLVDTRVRGACGEGPGCWAPQTRGGPHTLRGAEHALPWGEQPCRPEILGFLELGWGVLLSEHLTEEAWALRAVHPVCGKVSGCHLGLGPTAVWQVCVSLWLQLGSGEEVGTTHQAPTSQLLCCPPWPLPFLPWQGPLAQPPSGPVGCWPPGGGSQGSWTQVSLFSPEDLARLGMRAADLIHSWTRSSSSPVGAAPASSTRVQQFSAALLCALQAETRGPRGHIQEVQTLLSQEDRCPNPRLPPAGHLLLGLASREGPQEPALVLGASIEATQELPASGGEMSFSAVVDVKEVLRWLCWSREESQVKDVLAQIEDISVHLTSASEMAPSSFCLKRCQNLQRISLQVDRGIFLENDAESASGPRAERLQRDGQALCLWTDFCSVFSSNQSLHLLVVRQSFLSRSSVRILCEQMTRVTCHLQRVVVDDVSPVAAYQDFCLALIGKRTLTQLALEGSDLGDHRLLVLLGEALRHPRCHLQRLRLRSSPNAPQQLAGSSPGPAVSQPLKCGDPAPGGLREESVRLLCVALRHPKCSLQKLSLENCGLTEAFCQELSPVLMVSRALTHLCLAHNSLGDGGVKRLCEGLRFPECQLQTLLLQCCDITGHGCRCLSELFQQESSLTHLDLSLNLIAAGLCFLCEALKEPGCGLRCLGLRGCSITASCCPHLVSALSSNHRLETLDLGQNDLGQRGVTVLLEALKQDSGPLKTLRLKTDTSSLAVRKLLREVKESAPSLQVECDVGASKSSCCDFFS